MIIEENKENYVTGWIKSYRSKFKHWIANNKDYFYAWDWLLHNVNHKDGKVLINKELIEVKRGQRITSINNFANEVSMSPQQVRHFWDLLEKDKMITRLVTQRYTQITVCNYDTYQSEQQTNNKPTTNKQHTDNTLTTTNKNDNNVKKSKEFYANELISSNNNPKYSYLIDFLFGKNPLGEELTALLQLNKQISFENFKKLYEKSEKKEIKLSETILTLYNTSGYYKDKKSLYLTLNTWLNR